MIIPYRNPHIYKEEIERTMKELLDMDHIHPSLSPFTSSNVLVKMKDGNLRMCIDYRVINNKIIKNIYPIPRVDKLIDELHGAMHFSNIDLRLKYHYIRVKDEDMHTTTFRCYFVHFDFLVIPFGLTNAPTTLYWKLQCNIYYVIFLFNVNSLNA